MYWYLMVGSHKVDFGKHFGTMEGSGKVLDVWYGIAIWNGDVVQGSVHVVTTRSPVAVGLFRDHM